MYCEDEVLFFEERFEAHLEFDLALESAPVLVVLPTVLRMQLALFWRYVICTPLPDFLRPPRTGPPVHHKPNTREPLALAR